MRNAVVRLTGNNTVDVISPVVNPEKIEGVLQEVPDETFNAAVRDIYAEASARGERVAIVAVGTIPSRDGRLEWARRVVA